MTRPELRRRESPTAPRGHAGATTNASRSPRGAVSDPVLLEQDDAGLGGEFRQPAGGGETGDTGAGHHPAGVLLALEAVRRRRGGSIAYHPGA